MRNLIHTAVLAALNAEAAVQGGVGDEVNLTELAEQAEEVETDEERQARKARLDRAREQAQKTATDGTAVSEQIIGLAQKEIQECWKEFAGNGGVWDLTKQARSKMKNISKHILTIAQACAAEAEARAKADPDMDWQKAAARMFRNAMAMAENSLRGGLDLTDEEAEAKLDAFLSKSWTVYKSQVTSGFNAGLDPKDFDSIYAITKAAQVAKQAKNPGSRTDAQQESTEEAPAQEAGAEQTGGEPASEGQPPEDIAAIIAKESAKVQAALVLFHRAIDDTDLDDEELETKVANIIRMATKSINQLPRMAHDAEDEESVESEMEAKEA